MKLNALFLAFLLTTAPVMADPSLASTLTGSLDRANTTAAAANGRTALTNQAVDGSANDGSDYVPPAASSEPDNTYRGRLDRAAVQDRNRDGLGGNVSAVLGSYETALSQAMADVNRIEQTRATVQKLMMPFIKDPQGSAFQALTAKLQQLQGNLETARRNAQTAVANRDAAQGYARDRGYSSGREDNGPINGNGPGGNSSSGGGCMPEPGCGVPCK